ncbi:glucans biosynthesis glucosyltransferase MdoH [Luteimonas chenhongjianii]|uniref:Glucans biosynthesis glucosyltransferase H n=1 Tax=Luteimonas chenhongjianii TaxID=2006110 RepID=A0A290XHP1_9GAMM|nr:glucans biosynthesis glucosyltransferase MdoH [Luteimonas chenhongjianii]ATD68603.1 glucans biosynthesis glucosyltransferase MdoH [Luteimonas chenhongjianii]
MPEASPLQMPVQSLHEGRLARRPLPSAPRGMAWRRAFIVTMSAILTLFATYQIWWLLRIGDIDLLEGLLLLVFVPLFAWIVQSFASSLAGFALVLMRRPARLGIDPAAPLPALRERTALLMPTYNEDPERLFAGLQAIQESLEATGRSGHFDLFVLSDTRDEAIHRREVLAFERLRSTFPQARLYYRRREDNRERKAGNIADWVRRWGGAYPQFLILDADSLMTGDTLVRLAAAMEGNDDVALVQTLPVIVNGSTVFARMQQFSGRMYGPVIAHGVAWWHGAESNYWGHNALIRTAAFAAHGGLPELQGTTPFRGAVLSHDFVEAALIRRGGWALHMVPTLEGSYEEGPPTLTDMLVRDRRWCQGNLQHGGVLPARGLHWVSRWHLLIGIGHYLTAPLWAMLVLIGLAIPLQHGVLGDGVSPAQYWMAIDDGRFLGVFVLTMALLFAPKVFGYIATLADPRMRHGSGGAVRGFVSLLIENVFAALMAPVTMYVQSRGVAEVLAGRDSGWDAQRRDDGRQTWGDLWRNYYGTTALGLVMGVGAWWLSPVLVLWMSPMIIGLAGSIPIVRFTSSRTIGMAMRRAGLFATPEEQSPPEVLVRAAALRAEAQTQATAGAPRATHA